MTLDFLLTVSILIGLLLFLYHEARRSPGPMRWGKTPKWQKRVRVTLAAIPVVITCMVVWGLFIEPARLVIHKDTIQIASWPKELDGLRIAVLSDIHAGGPFIDEDQLRRIVQRTNELNPDLIVILGDYMTGNGRTRHQMEPGTFSAILKDFRAPLGVYSVLGNHDWWYGGLVVRAALEANGIKVLEEEVVEVTGRGKTFWLVGLADLWTRPQHIPQTFAKVPDGATMIALAHNPDIFPRLPERLPLLLAGHTHGGQVKLPIVGRPVESSRVSQLYAAGHVFENNHHLFVTTGIGTSILPIRFGVPPEIVLLTLKAQ